MSPDILTEKPLLPMLETSKEATLSEFSFSFEKPRRKIFLSKSTRYSLIGGVVILLSIAVAVLLFLSLGNLEEKHDKVESHVAFASCGPVEGVARDGGFEYRGIPYAIPLSQKKLKWQPAAPVSHLDHCWKGVLPFNPNPSECFQISSQGNLYGGDDCLTLDIYTPRSGYENPSHVVVVIATPTLAGGWPEDQTYKELAAPTSKFAAEHNIVYVVPRFRLGPLGFLPRLHINQSEFNPNITDFREEMIKARNDREAIERSYSLAISDLVAALSWIQLNIEDFGGESRSITLLGWGGGSTLVSALTSLTNLPGYPFLFTQAWIIGGSGYPLSNSSADSGTVPSVTLWENSPCNRGKYNPKCLFDLSTEDLFKSIPKEWINNNAKQNHQWLRMDSYWLRNTLGNAWTNGEITHDIPLVIGTGTEEIFQFPDEVQTNLSTIKFNLPKEVLQKLNWNSTEERQLLTDLAINCPLRNMARNASKHFSSDVYFYVSSSVSGKRGRVSVGFNDLAAILGNAAENPESKTIQKLFMDFLHNAALPRNVRASDGVYLVSENVTVSTSYGLCDNRELEHLWKEYAILN